MADLTGVPPLDAIPEPGSRIARLLLGRAEPTEEESRERFAKPTALAILSSDALSSVAYANEEMLRVLLPVAAAASFAFVVPISAVIILLLLTLIFSYRQTIRAYPSAGGAYIVTRDNFGVLLAQVAGVALLLDYVMTVAVSVSSGVAALYSEFPGLFATRVPLAVALIWAMTWGNLRGVRATGKLFASPTYLFVLAMFGIVGAGLVRLATGGLHRIPAPHPLAAGTTAAVGVFVLAHAYASGTTALTGVEAISNGVPVFRPVEWRNARVVLTWMGGLLAAMFAGLSVLTWKLRPIPTDKQTLLYQLGRAALGRSPVGRASLLVSQVMTTAILILAANTSFADFPRLASFHAGDGYLPAPLRRRGRRLSFSNGILTLAVVSTGVTVLFGADVHRLIPLFAVGAFASFTFSQAGMTRRHLRLREPGWRHSLVINGLGTVGSAFALGAIVVTKFTHGAWAVLVLVPGGVALFVSIHRHYQRVSRLMSDPGPDDPGAPATIQLVELPTPGEAGPRAGSAAGSAGLIRPDALVAERGAPWGGRGDDLRRQIARLAAPIEGRVVAVVLPPSPSGKGPLGLAARARLRRVQRWLRRQPGAVLVTRPRADARVVDDAAAPTRNAVVVVVDDRDLRARRAMALARLLAYDELHVVHVDQDHEATDDLVGRWPSQGFGVELEVLPAPYREPGGPVAWKVAELRARGAQRVTVVVAELVPRWWQRPLYQSQLRSIASALDEEPGAWLVRLPFPL